MVFGRATLVLLYSFYSESVNAMTDGFTCTGWGCSQINFIKFEFFKNSGNPTKYCGRARNSRQVSYNCISIGVYVVTWGDRSPPLQIFLNSSDLDHQYLFNNTAVFGYRYSLKLFQQLPLIMYATFHNVFFAVVLITLLPIQNSFRDGNQKGI